MFLNILWTREKIEKCIYLLLQVTHIHGKIPGLRHPISPDFPRVYQDCCHTDHLHQNLITCFKSYIPPVKNFTKVCQQLVKLFGRQTHIGKKQNLLGRYNKCSMETKNKLLGLHWKQKQRNGTGPMVDTIHRNNEEGNMVDDDRGLETWSSYYG